MGHGTERRAAEAIDEHALALEPLHDFRGRDAGPHDIEHEDVRFHGVDVDGDRRDRLQVFGQALRMFMVFLQPAHVVFECIHARSRQNPGLAHRPAVHPAKAPQVGHERGIAGDDERADRRPEALREAE